MPRGPRLIYDNAIVNITCRGNNKRIIFKVLKDYKYFEQLLLRFKKKYGLLIYRYSLMRNHAHLQLKIPNAKLLAKFMQSLQLAYFHHYGRRYNYVGRFWQGRFHSKIVREDKYLLTSSLYIEANPVKAGLVKNLGDYTWSSYNTYAHAENNPLVDCDPFYFGLGKSNTERCKQYRRLMDSYLKTKTMAI